MNIFLKRFLLFFFSWLPFQSLAQSPFWNFYGEHLDVTFFGGVIWGKAEEYVRAGTDNPLDPNFVVSQLDWPIENLFVLGGTFNFNYLSNRLHVTIEGWNKVASKRVKMIDEDFLTPDPAVLTNISTSPNTHLTSAYKIFGEATFDIFNFPPFKVGGIAGFQYSKFEWQAFGGSFLYYNDGDFTNSFLPNTLGIEYQQFFSVPYLGLIFKWEIAQFNACLFGKVSPIAFVQDIDYHALRGILFVDKYRNKTYYIVGAKAGFLLRQKVTFDLKYTYEELKKTVGNGFFLEATGPSPYALGNAFLAHNHSTFEMGLTAHF